MKTSLFLMVYMFGAFVLGAEINFSMLGLDISREKQLKDRKQFFELVNNGENNISLEGYTLLLYGKRIYRFDKNQTIKSKERKRFYFTDEKSDVKMKYPYTPLRPIVPGNDPDYNLDEINLMLYMFVKKYKDRIENKLLKYIEENNIIEIFIEQKLSEDDIYSLFILDLQLLDNKKNLIEEVVITNVLLTHKKDNVKIYNLSLSDNSYFFMNAIYFDDSNSAYGSKILSFPDKLTLKEIGLSTPSIPASYCSYYIFDETRLMNFIQGEKITITLYADADYTKELLSFTPEIFTKKEYDTLLSFLSGGKNVDCSKDVYYKLRIEHDSLPHLNKSYSNGKLKLSNNDP